VAPPAPEPEEADEKPSRPQLTVGMVQTAFRRVPLPASELVIQPPGGRTLVNFDTNFYTEAEPFRRSVRLLGQRVELDITPSAFTWRYGDGVTDTTTQPGAPYPDLQVTHAYGSKGTVRASVDTTYGAVADGVLVKFTFGGDANLDGAVSIADLGILAANWQQNGRGWWQGDFNYDGVVSIADLGILAANWQQQMDAKLQAIDESLRAIRGRLDHELDAQIEVAEQTLNEHEAAPPVGRYEPPASVTSASRSRWGGRRRRPSPRSALPGSRRRCGCSRPPRPYRWPRSTMPVSPRRWTAPATGV
jgi:hypothetical protein